MLSAQVSRRILNHPILVSSPAETASCFCGETTFFMDFSLLSPLEFFADPKNGDGRNNKPPAMRVRVDCYTKKLPFRLQ